MNPTDQLLTAVVILSAKANKKTLDETLRAFEVAGLIDHTYVGKEIVNVEYSFTSKAKKILEDIEER